MMRAAREAAANAAAQRGLPPPLVIAVTVLTSLSAETLKTIGVPRLPLQHVEELARLTHDAGLDGVVASPLEIATVRAACGSRFRIVTPGIRSAADEKGDQLRTLSAREALAAGADYIVVGRPIVSAPDPVRAAESFRI
jgi:orotidine-5'-phosphate decarboxylase